MSYRVAALSMILKMNDASSCRGLPCTSKMRTDVHVKSTDNKNVFWRWFSSNLAKAGHVWPSFHDDMIDHTEIDRCSNSVYKVNVPSMCLIQEDEYRTFSLLLNLQLPASASRRFRCNRESDLGVKIKITGRCSVAQFSATKTREPRPRPPKAGFPILTTCYKSSSLYYMHHSQNKSTRSLFTSLIPLDADSQVLSLP